MNIQKTDRMYQIDALKIPEELLKELESHSVYIVGSLYFYAGTDKRVLKYKTKTL